MRWAGIVFAGWLAVTTAAAAPTYSYDDQGRLIAAVYPDGTRQTFAYDAAGNRIETAANSAVGNRSPVSLLLTPTVNEGSTTPLMINPLTGAIDPDGDPLNLVSVSGADLGAATVVGDTQISYLPGPGGGVDTLYYVVADPQGASAANRILVTIANAAPAARNLSLTTTRNVAAVFDPLREGITDPGGDPFLVSAVQSFQNGVAAISPDQATVSFAPAANFNGTGSFQYKLRDSEGAESTPWRTVSVLVSGGNSAPVADDDSVTSSRRWDNESFRWEVVADVLDGDVDPDGDLLTVRAVLVTLPASGTAEVVTDPDGRQTIRYSHGPLIAGPGRYTDSFSYRVSDGGQGGGLTDDAIVSVALQVAESCPITCD